MGFAQRPEAQRTFYHGCVSWVRLEFESPRTLMLESERPRFAFLCQHCLSGPRCIYLSGRGGWNDPHGELLVFAGRRSSRIRSDPLHRIGRYDPSVPPCIEVRQSIAPVSSTHRLHLCFRMPASQGTSVSPHLSNRGARMERCMRFRHKFQTTTILLHGEQRMPNDVQRLAREELSEGIKRSPM